MLNVGDIFEVHGGSTVTVIEYHDCNNVIVKHNDDVGYIVSVRARNLRKGHVKNPFHPSVYGVGFIGVGDHKVSINGKHTKEYKLWCGILERGYSEDRKIKYPTYKECRVDPRWYNFQNFAEWCKHQAIREGWQIDKDLIVMGNKLYSPELCRIVPSQINSILLDSGSARGNLPQGVSRRYDKYYVQLNIDGASIKLGDYSTINEAFEVYKKEKEKNVKRVAEKYKDVIDPLIYNFLINYEVPNTQ